MHLKGMKKALGDYGERELAPKLLERIGLQQLVDLNQKLQFNFPWADFCGKKEGQWWMVNVKTRFKWEKPQPGKPRTLNSSYNTTRQALENYNNAMDILKKNDFVDCKAMWLAIALEIDQTYEAYWGEAEEMRNFMDFDKPHISWDIPMGKKATKKYRNENRIVADRKPHNFDWLLYPDNWWTYDEHLNWRKKQGLG